ncbi:unnamed protein product [Strongylus vulgaris]|uniref:Uncharacterized protein n=1 Tax=Strongylus vulgaris TaxID=40348 RepID=A0A3P7J3Z0_STRVU|nr:unnamed protein product [Strongylus vulgaris]
MQFADSLVLAVTAGSALHLSETAEDPFECPNSPLGDEVDEDYMDIEELKFYRETALNMTNSLRNHVGSGYEHTNLPTGEIKSLKYDCELEKKMYDYLNCSLEEGDPVCADGSCNFAKVEAGPAFVAVSEVCYMR